MTARIVAGLAEVASPYDAFILDLWGVVHDGVNVFPGVIDALARLRRAGKRLVFLSNAPRRAEVVAAQLDGFGITRDLHDGVLSSGEVTWRHLEARPDAWYRDLGRSCIRIGPDRADGLLDGLGLTRPADLAAADFILVPGPNGDTDSVEAYDPQLDAAAARDLPMVCANPDREVIRGGRRQICAGAIAERYERKGGDVRWHGKPNPDVYEDCLEMLAIADPSRVLCCGDSFTTDIKGANEAGLDALLVARGIHGDDLVDAGGALDADRVRDAAADAGAEIRYATREFVW